MKDWVKGDIMDYKVKNKDGGYFVEWIGQLPVFNTNIMMGKRLSESGANNLIELLANENLGLCEKVAVPESIDIR